MILTQIIHHTQLEYSKKVRQLLVKFAKKQGHEASDCFHFQGFPPRDGGVSHGGRNHNSKADIPFTKNDPVTALNLCVSHGGRKVRSHCESLAEHKRHKRSVAPESNSTKDDIPFTKNDPVTTSGAARASPAVN